jgi:serine protease Do
MKRLTPVILSSFLSAFLAVFIFQKIHTPDQIVIRETLPVSYVNHSPDMESADYELGSANAPRDFVMAANSARSAVVSIQALSAASFWSGDGVNSSTGSGVIISSDGFIATNKHVIDEGSEIYVMLNDQREYKAEVVGSDATTDLALLKIDADKLIAVQFGNSDSLFVGEWVLAIGNPFRLRSTVTAGIVSAKGRNISILPDQTGIESFIQTDAAVNPGNSGGALVNTSGELVGINTAIITYSGQYEGFSFAVPSNLARKVLKDLRIYGSVQRGWLGIVIRSIDNKLADELKMDKVAGVYIDNVNPSSAANAAGLEKGDVVVAVDGVEVEGSPQFMEQVGRHGPGDHISIDYIRNGSILSTNVTLSSRQNAVSTEREYALDDENAEILSDIGISVRELTRSEMSRFKKDGIFVETIETGSAIDRVKMKQEYIITSVNGNEVSTVQELIHELLSATDMVVLDGFYEKYPGDYPYAFHK